MDHFIATKKNLKALRNIKVFFNCCQVAGAQPDEIEEDSGNQSIFSSDLENSSTESDSELCYRWGVSTTRGSRAEGCECDGGDIFVQPS